MVTLPLIIKPFEVPEYVMLDMPAGGKQDGPVGSVYLQDLPDDVLAALIEEFANAVMKAARPD